MALNFSELFPPGRVPNLNYDYSQVSANIGSIEFDLAPVIASASFEKRLISTSFSRTMYPTATGISGVNYTASGSTTSSTTENIIDADFDTNTFQSSAIIQGDMLVRIPYAIDGTGDRITIVFRIRLKKYDGTTETEIASALLSSVAFTSTLELCANAVLVVPKTIIKKGELLRVTLEMDASNDDNVTTVEGYICYDPNDQAQTNFTAGNSRSVVSIPFNIEV